MEKEKVERISAKPRKVLSEEQILEIDKIGLSYLFNVDNCIRKDA